MSNSLLLFFSLHSLRLSGDCAKYRARAIANLSARVRACVLLGKWAVKKNFRKTQTDEGQTCDKLAPDGHVWLS